MLQTSCVKRSEPISAFTFSIFHDPSSFDPIDHSPAASSYVYNALYTPLLKFQDDKLKASGATACVFVSPLRVQCALDSHLRFSDGKSVRAEHYVQSFRQMFLSPAGMTEYFLGVKNARAVLAKKAPIETLKVIATGDFELQFELEHEDTDFLYRLIVPATTARPTAGKLNGELTTGLYYLNEYALGRHLEMKPNIHHTQFRTSLPNIKVMIVGNEETARYLFETGKLNFLPRLTFEQIRLYKNHKGFFFVPFLRADYLGFHSKKTSRNIRKNLSNSPDYNEISVLMSARGPVGCPTLPESYFSHRPCYPREKDRAVLTAGDKNIIAKMRLGFSKLGGDDVENSMQWFQEQWSKQAGIKIPLQGYEQGVFTKILKDDPPAVFRRGFNLARPTCRALLENFTSGHANNFIQYQNKKLDAVVEKMAKTSQEQETKKLCTEGFEVLMQDYAFIPLGEIHFSMVSDSKFSGFKINSLNHIDFTGLKRESE